MTTIGRIVDRGWPVTRVIDVDSDGSQIWLFDAEEPSDGEEPGHVQVTPLDDMLADRLDDLLHRAAALVRAPDRRQPALPLEGRMAA